jgi:Holliday junction DNA helicase RuvB
LQQGFVARTPRGRMLAHKGYGHLGLTPPAVVQTGLFGEE